MWSDYGGNYWPIWSACAVFVTQQVGCSRKKCSWLAHSLSLESRKTFPSTWSLLASPITTSCASAVPPAVTGSGVSTSRQQVCVADLPALKHYLSTWYYRDYHEAHACQFVPAYQQCISISLSCTSLVWRRLHQHWRDSCTAWRGRHTANLHICLFCKL